jgi:hypothetical protein
MRVIRILAPCATLVILATAAGAQGAPGTPAQPTATAATAATAAAAAAAKPKPLPLPADSFDLARKYTKWFYERQVDSLIAHHVEALRQQPGLAARISSSKDELSTRAGKELWVSDERFVTRNGQRQYWRTATFSDFAEPLIFRWVMTPAGEISGIGMGPQSQAPAIDPAP